MIFGSSIPLHYFLFYCQTIPRIFYMVSNSIFCLLLAKMVTGNTFQENEYQTQRSIFFLAYGFFSAIPFVHCLVNNDGVLDTQMYKIFIIAFLYSLGAILYAAFVPERFSPGTFDLFLNSHQILHVCVVAASIVHYF